MINSMTGFASSEQNTAQGKLLWELRTVNHRYLESTFKLPDGFRALEPVLRECVGARLKRGKLDAVLQFRPAASVTAALQVNAKLADEVIREAQVIETRMEAPVSMNAMDVLRWPGVVEQDATDTKALYEPASALLDTALASLCDARAREGQRIMALLEERLDQIAALVAQVREHMPEVLEGIRTRVGERAKALETRIDDERLEQELVLLAQKMDVAEELDRLDAHIEEAREAFQTEGTVGRRLDFLMQEFNREANTLGSKSADPRTTKAAVDLKVLIEQMREQVQNIE
ncbi:MAG: YicC family protein [Chromatiales bacterium]|nr:YicC family protein [Chromatiales bacterium]